ncbi:MAG: TIR domain-containing protein [Pyrinomonadaceae bacterium]
MAHDVFISHSTKDKQVADAVCARLEAEGVRCWIAPRDIMPGSDWGEAIVDAIGASRVMVIVISANAVASQQIKREAERAVNKGVVIIPFRVEDVQLSKSLEYFISSTHWLDALTPPLEYHIGRLADSIKALLSKGGAREPLPPPKSAPWPRAKRGFMPFIMGGVGALAVVGVLVIAFVGYVAYRTLPKNGNAPVTNAPVPQSARGAPSSLTATPESPQEIEADKTRLSALRTTLLIARSRGDARVLNLFLADEFREVQPDRQSMTKAQILDEANRRAAGTEPPFDYTVSSMIVRYNGTGDPMILTDYTVKGPQKDEHRQEIMLMRKQSDGWKAILSRYTTSQ